MYPLCYRFIKTDNPFIQNWSENFQAMVAAILHQWQWEVKAHGINFLLSLSLSEYSLWSIHRVHMLPYQFLVIIIWWLLKWIILKKWLPAKKVMKHQVLIQDPRGLLSNHRTSSLPRSYTSAIRCKMIITHVGFNIAYMHQTAVAKPKPW